MISVIVPVYNARTYLSECVCSILNQSDPDYEVILIDDGSTDGSSDICDDFAVCDERVRVVHTENRGVSSARNIGMRMARGSHIIFVDSDDTLLEHAIELLHDAIRKNDVDALLYHYAVIGAGLERPSNKGLPQGFYKSAGGLAELKASIAFGELNGYVFQWMVSRRVFQRVTFEPDIVYREDSVFVMRVLNECQSVGVVDDVLYVHRRNSESFTANYWRSERRIEATASLTKTGWLLIVEATRVPKLDVSDLVRTQRSQVSVLVRHLFLSVVVGRIDYRSYEEIVNVMRRSGLDQILDMRLGPSPSVFVLRGITDFRLLSWCCFKVLHPPFAMVKSVRNFYRRTGLRSVRNVVSRD